MKDVISKLIGNWELVIGFLLVFSWMHLTGVVRAEFLRGRNLDYVRAAKALGVSDVRVMWRHILPNAMVATLTFLPFTLSGSVTVLASLDFLGPAPLLQREEVSGYDTLLARVSGAVKPSDVLEETGVRDVVDLVIEAQSIVPRSLLAEDGSDVSAPLA